MNVLVTGGAGFIGSHLCETLLAQGDHVTVIDNLATGSPNNIEHLVSNPSFKLVVDNVLNQSLTESLVGEADQVFHLASAVGVKLIIDQPVQTIETIVEGTCVVADAARKYERPFLITSTSEVYGKGSKIPFAEEDDIVLGATSKRRWVYACAKMLDEFLALSHWHESKLPTVCVRLFNTVGPRQTGQYGMVLPRFVQQALNGEPITVYGDGEQSRCFCHVSDAVGALIALLRTDEAHGKVVNVGSDEEVSMNRLAERIVNITGSDSEIHHIPYEQAYVEGFEDMQRRVPDLSRAGQLINYRPSKTLDQIISSTVEYWQSKK